MGFSDLLYSNPITAGPYALYKNFGQGSDAAASQGQTESSSPKTTPYKAKQQSVQDFANSIFNTEKAREYGGIVDQAYQNLGQPLHDSPHDVNGQVVGNRDEIYVNATRGLASAFADSVYKKTGQLPSEDQVKNFVAQNLTQGFAQKFITGMPTDQITALADQHVDANPDQYVPQGQANQAQADQDRILGLNKQLDQAYDAGANNYVQSYNDRVYAPAKQQTANDLAGQGMLTQPNSRYSLDAIEANRGRDISSGLNTLAGERAKGSVGLGTTIEGLLQSQQGINNQNMQFNKNFGLANQQFNAAQDQNTFNQGLQNRSLDIAGQIGRMQAEGKKKDWMDYLNTGLNVAKTGAGIAAMG